MTETDTHQPEVYNQEVALKPHGCLSYEDARAEEMRRQGSRLRNMLVVIPLLGCSFLSTGILTVYILFWPYKVESLVSQIPTLVLMLWVPLVIAYLAAMMRLLPRIARWHTEKIFPPRPASLQ